MPWARIDDRFCDNFKVLGLRAEGYRGLAATGLWTYCLAWAHAHTRDRPPPEQGLIPRRAVTVYGGQHTEDLAALLCEVGLWHPAGDGWRIHDFREWCALEAREAQRAGGRKGAAKRWHPTLFDDPPNGEANGVPVGNPSVPHGNPNGTHPTPTQPNNFLDTCQEASTSVSEFGKFYDAYPRHVGRGAAEKAWCKAVKGTPAPVIIAAAERYAEQREGQDPKFTPHPATWLNQGRWADEDEGGCGGSIPGGVWLVP